MTLTRLVKYLGHGIDEKGAKSKFLTLIENFIQLIDLYRKSNLKKCEISNR